MSVVITERTDAEEFQPQVLICFYYLIFGLVVIVTLMLNVGGAQDLQVVVRLSQVLHCCGHVQGVDPAQGANQQIQVSHGECFIMWLHCCSWLVAQDTVCPLDVMNKKPHSSHSKYSYLFLV